jgi:hypothetical protein
MFRRSSDDVALPLQAPSMSNAAKSKVIALRSTACKKNLPAVRADSLREYCARFFERPLRLTPERVDGRRVAEYRGKIRAHRFEDTVVERSGGGMIKVDSVHGSGFHITLNSD